MTSDSKSRRTRVPVWRSRAVTTVALAALVAGIAWLLWPPERLPSPFVAYLHQMEWNGYDALFALRGTEPQRVDPRVVVVGYDENTAQALNTPWPPSRRMQAQVIDRLVADGARLIVFDVLFSGASTPQDDRALDAALSRAQCVVLSSQLNRDLAQARVSLEMPYADFAGTSGIDFEMHALSSGCAQVASDDDDVVRRFLPAMYFQDEWIATLPTAAYLALNGKDESAIRVTPSTVYLDTLMLPRTGMSAKDPIYPRISLPSTLIDFPGGVGSFPQLPIQRFDQVYLGQTQPGIFKGKVVFVGVTGDNLARSKGELFKTAYSHLCPEESGAAASGHGSQITTMVPGVLLQAQFFNALLTRGFRHTVPVWAYVFIVFAYAFIAILTIRQSLNWRGPALLGLTLVGYLALASSLFIFAQTFLPWVIPTLLVVVTTAPVAWLERGRLKRKWGGYLSPAVLEHILRQEIDMQAERQEATVIFGDVRGFTNFSEQHAPEVVLRLLNRHLERLTTIVYDAGGTIDKFLGDGILIVFGSPLPMADAAVRAVRSAWLMREASLQPITDDDGTPYTLGSGFGVTTGPLVAGHVGSHARHEFTIIGDTVNLASRLQGVTGKPDVIIDTATYQRVRDFVEVESLGEVTLKGKSHPIPCYRVTAWRE